MATGDELKLPAAMLEKWDTWYARTIGCAATDAEELALIHEYQARAQEGFTLTETGEEARVGRQRWTVEASEPAASAQPAGARQKRVLVALMVGATLLMCALLAAILSPMLKPGGRAQAAAGTTGTPALDPAAAPVLVDVGGNQRFTLDTPRSLEIRGAPFQIVAGEVTNAGALKYPQLREGFVVWFPSPANWLVGADARVVAAIAAEDVILARTATGRVLRFVVDQVNEMRPQEVEALAQGRAGLVVFPLLSEGDTVRLVSARYDPAGEQPSTTQASDARLGQALAVDARTTLTVTAAEVQRRRDGLSVVTVSFTRTGTLPPLLLDVQGQLYPQVQGTGADPVRAEFYVTSLGPAALVVAGKRVDLGELAPPLVAGQIEDMALVDTTLLVTCTLSSTAGSAGLAPGDIALQVGSGGPGGELAPLGWTPADVIIAPGAPARVVVQFPWPRGAAWVRVRLFDTLWDVTGPTP